MLNPKEDKATKRAMLNVGLVIKASRNRQAEKAKVRALQPLGCRICANLVIVGHNGAFELGGVHPGDKVLHVTRSRGLKASEGDVFPGE